MARTFLVSGATGRQGGAVARSLLRRGASVRCLTRSPEKARELVTAGAEVVRGDLRKKETVTRALKGVDGFFVVTTPFDAGLTAPNYEEEALQAKTAFDATRTAGTSHLILSSAAPPTGAEDLPVFRSKADIERLLADQKLPSTVVRSATFMETFTSPATIDGLRSGQLMVPGFPPNQRVDLVAIRDLGEFVASAFVHPVGSLGRTVDLVGDSRTVSEIAQLLGAALDRSISVAPPSEGSPPPASGPSLDDDAAHRQKVESQILDLQHRWGIRFTRFEVFLRSSDVRARVEAPAPVAPSAAPPKRRPPTRAKKKG